LGIGTVKSRLRDGRERQSVPDGRGERGEQARGGRRRGVSLVRWEKGRRTDSGPKKRKSKKNGMGEQLEGGRKMGQRGE